MDAARLCVAPPVVDASGRYQSHNEGKHKMKVLVAVASRHGSTRDIGEVIARELRATGLTVDVRDAKHVDTVQGYDAVVLGSAVYIGNWLAEAKQFGERHRDELLKLPVWVFSSGPLGLGKHQPENDPQALVASLGDIPIRDHKVFVGKLDPSDLGLGEELIVKMVRAPYGDFRNWVEIRRWARGIASQLSTEPAH